MAGPRRHAHFSHRTGWLRAAVLGANDGIISTASLILGIAGAGASHSAVLIAGIAGLTSGALSMAAGEYVSVSSQKDSEQADAIREQIELDINPAGEQLELAQIYVKRGLSSALAEEVARQLTEFDALGAHMRDEIGLHSIYKARPVQAGLASAAAFTAGAVLPVALAAWAPVTWLFLIVPSGSLLFLAILGAVAAWAGGARLALGAVRVTFWGSIAMLATYGVGALFGGSY